MFGRPRIREFAMRLCLLVRAEATNKVSPTQLPKLELINRHAKVDGKSPQGLDPTQRSTGN